jgi:hypothetical protein
MSGFNWLSFSMYRVHVYVFVAYQNNTENNYFSCVQNWGACFVVDALGEDHKIWLVLLTPQM